MPCVYILLARSSTLLSRAIHHVTQSRYTHASLSLDRRLAHMYSFARLNPATPLPAGFVREDLYRGVYARNAGADCLLLELPVSEQAYGAIAARLAAMEQNAADYRYDLLGLALNLAGRAHARRGKYVCSHFVAEVLAHAGALRLPKHPSLMRPQDFACLPGLRPVYCGPVGRSGCPCPAEFGPALGQRAPAA